MKKVIYKILNKYNFYFTKIKKNNLTTKFKFHNQMLKNIRVSIKNNLESFDGMTAEDIITQRKNKFLKIGRTDGFVSQKSNNIKLTADNNFFDNLKNKLLQKKSLYILLSLIILIGLLSLLK